MDAILELAHMHKLRVVEDAAHAFPTLYKGRLIGTMASDVTVFSFYANKTMTTGEGGMVVTRDAELANRIKMMRIHGISRDAFDRYVSKSPAWFYEVVAPGFKYNLTDIASALGIHQLAKIDRFLQRRQELARGYFEGLKDLPLRLPADANEGGQHAWHLYVVRLTSGARMGRDDLIQKLSDRGIGTSVHYIPLHRHPYWRDTYHLQPEQFPEGRGSVSVNVKPSPLYQDDRCRSATGYLQLKGIAVFIKRVFDFAAALVGLIFLAPLFVVVACWIKLDSDGPIFFRQQRVGRHGVPFRIFKFRTMAVDTEAKGQITVGNDVRITDAGKFLRHYKIDELPQLINVLLGEMSLVGPRPEVPRYVACYPQDIREIVLSVAPGITDWAAIEYKDESNLLGLAQNSEQTYIEDNLASQA